MTNISTTAATADQDFSFVIGDDRSAAIKKQLQSEAFGLLNVRSLQEEHLETIEGLRFAKLTLTDAFWNIWKAKKVYPKFEYNMMQRALASGQCEDRDFYKRKLEACERLCYALYDYAEQCASQFLLNAVYGAKPRGADDIIAYAEEVGLPENGPAKRLHSGGKSDKGVMGTFAGQTSNRWKDLFVIPSKDDAKHRTYLKKPAMRIAMAGLADAAAAYGVALGPAGWLSNMCTAGESQCADDGEAYVGSFEGNSAVSFGTGLNNADPEMLLMCKQEGLDLGEDEGAYAMASVSYDEGNGVGLADAVQPAEKKSIWTCDCGVTTEENTCPFCRATKPEEAKLDAVEVDAETWAVVEAQYGVGVDEDDEVEADDIDYGEVALDQAKPLPEQWFDAFSGADTMRDDVPQLADEVLGESALDEALPAGLFEVSRTDMTVTKVENTAYMARRRQMRKRRAGHAA